MHLKPRIVVVSPLLDKQHGTERCVSEQVERLSGEFEIHLYGMRVEGVNLSGIVWHRIPALPGPHLTAYLWWLVANHLWRWWDRTFRGLSAQLVYSPGINCLDATLISVHIVFAEFLERMGKELWLRRNPPASWLRFLHRGLYYRLIIALERWIYRREETCLAGVSGKVAADLGRFYGRRKPIPVVYYGLDHARFHPGMRARLRAQARAALGLRDADFALLLIGNDWKKKGLTCLLEAMVRLGDPSLCLLVVGEDTPVPYAGALRSHGLEQRVRFLPLRADVESYYAAADIYVGPSLEDAFALPPAEAMACGLPVIVSRLAGVSEWVHHRVDGLILEDARDAGELARLVQLLQSDVGLRRRMGENAVKTVQPYTCDHNAQQMKQLKRGAILPMGGQGS